MTVRGLAPGAVQGPAIGVHAGGGHLGGAGHRPQQQLAPAAAQIDDTDPRPQVQLTDQKVRVLLGQGRVPAHPSVPRCFEIITVHRVQNYHAGQLGAAGTRAGRSPSIFVV